MRARLKRTVARTTRTIDPLLRSAVVQRDTSLRLSSAVTQAQRALCDCIGALCAIEVTLHSFELQDMAPAEQEVLKRALQAVSCAQEWLAARALRGLVKD
ncbi:MAG: hypothetical protein QM808_02310 [Steroidobacteraceae bacterium]